MGMFIIRCRTSGGVTGTRHGYLKRSDAVLTFHTAAEADENLPPNKHLTTGAHLEYWVEEHSAWPRCECGHIAQDHNKLLPDKNHACDQCACPGYQPNRTWCRVTLGN